MSISNKDRIGTALESLRRELYPYVELMMQKVYGSDWTTQAILHLPNHQKIKQSPDQRIREDVSALLIVINKEWEKKTFKNSLSLRDRALVQELLTIRHSWAHSSTFSIDETYRAIDSIFLLLQSIAAPQLEEIKTQRQEVFRLLSQNQTRYQMHSKAVLPAEEARIRQELDPVLKRLPFENAALLSQALTHTSYKYENPNTGEDNEQLEFLGDAVLTFLSGEFLFKHNPDLKEGRMTVLRSNLVDSPQLAKFALDLSLGRWMRLGRGEDSNGGRDKPSLLSNVFEAVVGAYYLDSGIEAVRNLVYPFFEHVLHDLPTAETAISGAITDAKSQLQQVVLAPTFSCNPHRQPPEYKTIRSGGTDNDPEFTSVVYVAGGKYGSGRDRSKKEAEKRAAEDALRKLS